MKILSPLALCLAAMLIAGCAKLLKSDYHAPAVDYPASWYHDGADGKPAPFDWNAFNDPLLESHVA